MPFYHSLGRLPRKRHTVLRREEGGICYEQLMGNKGFVGPSSLLYHLRPPTAVLRVEPVTVAEPLEPDPDRRLRHRHLRTGRAPAGGSPTQDRLPLLANPDLTIACARPDRDDPCFYRNGLADEYVFVHQGKGRLETQLGELEFGPGDQLVVPRGILQRYRIEEPAWMLVVESRGYLRWPRRYRGEHGQLLEGAPFSERDIRRPARLPTEDEQGEFEIQVKQVGGLTRIVLDHHPFDVVGWDGCYYPWAMSIHDFEPIVGRIHQPPPVHQFLESDGFVLCNFCPRPFDFDPQAIPAPYAHSNVMSDEVLYYASGDFMSRRGIEPGSITLHPDGIPHGPHPGRYEASVGAKRTDELAVMIDTFQPLVVTRAALELEDPSYPLSWTAP